jgi:general secretion pathway protein E
MRVMIHDGAGEHEREREARQLTPGIRDDGRAKVIAGVTSLEELFRVAREE